MIEITMEAEEWWGESAEACLFCGRATRTWHKSTNTPMCERCAQVNEVEEIGKAEEGKKVKSNVSPGFEYQV